MTTYQIIGGDGRQYGPITESELRKWFVEGRLNGQSLVLREGGAEWQPLARLAELTDLFGASNVPPPIGAAASPTEWSNRILARQTDLRLGECFRSGFSFLAGNPGLVLGAVTLTWLLKFVTESIPLIGLLLGGVFTGGLYLTSLRRMRGEAASISDVFSGFKQSCPQLILVGVLSNILSGFGFALGVLPGLYLLVGWTFALPLVLDKRLEFWSAMELSRKMTTRVWFQVFLLLSTLFLPALLLAGIGIVKCIAYVFTVLRNTDFELENILRALPDHIFQIFKLYGLWQLLAQVAVLICQYFAVGALMRAYENLFGERTR